MELHKQRQQQMMTEPLHGPLHEPLHAPHANHYGCARNTFLFAANVSHTRLIAWQQSCDCLNVRKTWFAVGKTFPARGVWVYVKAVKRVHIFASFHSCCSLSSAVCLELPSRCPNRCGPLEEWHIQLGFSKSLKFI